MNFDVETWQDGRWWMVRIPAIDGLTNARSRDEVETAAREYLALMQDRSADEFDVTVTEKRPHDD